MSGNGGTRNSGMMANRRPQPEDGGDPPIDTPASPAPGAGDLAGDPDSALPAAMPDAAAALAPAGAASQSQRTKSLSSVFCFWDGVGGNRTTTPSPPAIPSPPPLPPPSMNRASLRVKLPLGRTEGASLETRPGVVCRLVEGLPSPPLPPPPPDRRYCHPTYVTLPAPSILRPALPSPSP